jgi:uncharacterized RDD family membrane protein YckC
MGIRVRHADSGGKISIPNACLRIVVKLLLGTVSFFLIPVTRKGRGLHDFAAGSVVLKYQEKTGGLADSRHFETG